MVWQSPGRGVVEMREEGFVEDMEKEEEEEEEETRRGTVLKPTTSGFTFTSTRHTTGR